MKSPRTKPYRSIGILLLGMIFAATGLATAQTGSGSGKGAGGSPAGSNGSATSGYTYPQALWNSALHLRPTDHTVVACYSLASTTGTSPPVVLTPVKSLEVKCSDIDLTDDTSGRSAVGKACATHPATGRVNVCDTPDSKHPLTSAQQLVVAIDARATPTQQLQSLTINLTNQQGAAINPTGLRSSFGASSTPAGSLSESFYFLTWPASLPGDNIASVTVSTVFSPPAPGAAWAPRTIYPIGSIVTPAAANGHYWMLHSLQHDNMIAARRAGGLQERPCVTATLLVRGRFVAAIVSTPRCPTFTGAAVTYTLRKTRA